MRKANVLPIAVMAFALVGFLFVLDYSIGDTKFPWSEKNANQATTSTTDETVLTEINTNTANLNTSSTTNSSTSNKNSNTSVVTNDNTNQSTNTNTTDTTAKYLSVRFVDTKSQVLIANTKLTLYSDNGVRCVTEPCPTNGRTWTSVTDDQGRVDVPIAYVDESMTFTLTGYLAKELHSGSYDDGDGSWKLLLTTEAEPVPIKQ